MMFVRGLFLLFVLFSSQICFADILQMSDERYLEEDDLAGLSTSDLRLARNEIYARHGYVFNSSDLQNYFSQYDWYQPKTKSVNLSAIEAHNVQFIKKYEDNPQLVQRLATKPSVNETNNITNNEVTIVNLDTGAEVLQAEFDRLSSEVEVLKMLFDLQSSLFQVDQNTIHKVAQTEIDAEINKRQPKLDGIEDTFVSKYDTPIKPENKNLQFTALELADLFPRVPFYKPGTTLIGEFRFLPVVSNDGFLVYKLQFVDPENQVDNIIGEVSFQQSEVEIVRDALRTSNEYSDKLQQNGISKLYQNKITCFPEDKCAEKVAGNSSVEIVFNMNEDGATGTRVVQNKGEFEDIYAMSIESTALLASYLDMMIETGSKEFQAGKMDNADIDALLEGSE